MLAGFVRIDITPPVGIGLGGYGYYLRRFALGIHDPLYVRALAVGSEDDRFLIISCDIVALDAEMVEVVKSEIGQATGLPAEAIILHCIHTHSGPATASMRGCGVKDDAYLKTLQSKLIEAGRKALETTKPVTSIAYSESTSAGIGYNRTELEIKPIDHTIRSLFIHREHENPIVLVNYACHPVVSGDDTQVSADYPGQLMAALDERHYDGIFINGFCGDINPVDPRDYDAMTKHGQEMAKAVVDSEASAVQLCCEKIQVGMRNISVPLDIPSRQEILSELLAAKCRLEADPTDMLVWPIISWTADALAEVEKPDFPHSKETYLQAATIGDLAFIAFPGETFTAFGLKLREEFKDLRLMTVNAANGMIGYIPTAGEFDIHGYAAYDAARIYGIFMFEKGFGEQIGEEASKLLAEMTSRGI